MLDRLRILRRVALLDQCGDLLGEAGCQYRRVDGLFKPVRPHISTQLDACAARDRSVIVNFQAEIGDAEFAAAEPSDSAWLASLSHSANMARIRRG